MHPSASSLVTLGIFGITLCVAVGAVLLFGLAAAHRGEDRADATRRAALAVVAWIVATGVLGASGLLLRFDLLVPPFLVLFVSILALGVVLARSRAGETLAMGLPLWGLVLFQSYRLPLELVMHLAGVEGTMPVALSFDGQNFDILTGGTALGLGLASKLRARPVPLWVVHGWNLLGIAALVNIARIALLSSPLVGYYGPDQLSTWVAHVPFVWLPAVLVVGAIAGHGVVLRRLLSEAKLPSSAPAALRHGEGPARAA